MGDRIGHAEIRIGNSTIMLTDENEQFGAHSAKHYNGSPVSMYVYVEDIDSAAKKAEAAGAMIERQVETQF